MWRELQPDGLVSRCVEILTDHGGHTLDVLLDTVARREGDPRVEDRANPHKD